MAYNIKFNGFDLNFLCRITDVRRPILPGRETTLIEIPNKDGGHLQNVRHKPEYVEVDIIIFGENNASIRNNARYLGSILSVKKEVPIIFSDEPNITYYGLLADDSPLDHIAKMGKGTLKFLFPYPVGYEPEKEEDVTLPTHIIDNDTNTPIYPVVEAYFKTPSTFFSVADPDGNVVLVGSPDDPIPEQVNPVQRVLWDEMDNLTRWQQGNFSQVDGIAQGTFKTNGYSFGVDDWGTSPGNSIWYGPAAKRSLVTPIDDFRVDMEVVFSTDVQRVGRIELYLLDSNNAIIGRINLVDAYPNYKEPSVWIWAGNPKAHHLQLLHEWTGAWTYFDGILRIERQGKTWSAWVAEKTSKGFEKGKKGRTPIYWTADNTGPLAQVMIHIGGMAQYSAPAMSIHDIKVYKLNNVAQDKAPQILQQGDKLEIDFFSGEVKKNGEYWMEYLDAGSRFFSVPPGQSEIAFFPSDPNYADVRVKYKKGWLL